MFHTPPSTDLTAREAELASRSDTGLRKQTGEGEAFTGGGMLFPPKKWSLSRFLPLFLPAERNWHREAILACVSRLAKAKPLLAAGCSSRQKWSLSRFLPRRSLYWRRDALPAKEFTFLPLSLP